MSMYVKELWRYPVKSMRGESLSHAEISVDGISGDRVVLVQNARGLTTARSHPDLLGLAATTDDTGGIRVEGFPWRDGGADELVDRAGMRLGPTLTAKRGESRPSQCAAGTSERVAR